MMSAQTIDRGSFRGRLEAAVDAGPVSLGLADLQDFHGINAKHGHDVGDRILEHVGTFFADRLPDTATVSRIGGDEFACLLPDVSPEEALLALDAVRTDLGASAIDAGSARVRVGVRFGVASFPHHGEDASELMAAAEQALHRAGALGGDRVAIYVEDKMVMKSNYYPRAQLDRLARLAAQLDRTEASLLRESLNDLLERHRPRL